MDRSAPRFGRATAIGVTLALAGVAVLWVMGGGRVQASEPDRTPVTGRGRAVSVEGGTVKVAAPTLLPARRAVGRALSRKPGGTWAVVIGANDYAGTAYDLRAGVADATDVDALLAARGVPPSQRRVLLDGEVTTANVRAAIRWLVKHAGPASDAVFFFSGHVRQKPGDPDGDGEDIDESMVFPDGGQIFDGELARMLKPLRARRTWIGMAACYGAGMDDVMKVVDGVLTAASPEDELAYENDRFLRTYLVQYMVRQGMLEGAAGAGASLQDAFRWADGRIDAEYPTRRPVMVDTLERPFTLG